MLSKRFRNDKKPSINLNELQVVMKKQVERKIEEGAYSFENAPCCVCSGNDFEILSEKDRYGLYVPVVICRDCGLILTNPRMTQESCNQFYDVEYRKLYMGKDTPTEEYFRDEYHSGKWIYEFLENSLRSHLNNLKVLEVGTGAGGILYYFKKKGNFVCGCDLDSEYVEFGREKYALDLSVGTISDIDMPWTPDIVIYSHVLEHILNPVEELIKLRSIINKNSLIYVELPGVKYLIHSRCYEMNFLKQLQNAHIYYFTLRTLKNVLGKAGYTLLCGNEMICSIFKPSLNSNKKQDYESDYDEVIAFLRRMEFLRYFYTPYSNIKSQAMPVMIRSLKRAGLYNTAKWVYDMFKD